MFNLKFLLLYLKKLVIFKFSIRTLTIFKFNVITIPVFARLKLLGQTVHSILHV